MKVKNTIYFVLFLLAQNFLFCSNEIEFGREYYRDYILVYGVNNDILNASENFRTVVKIFSDVYYRGIEKNIKNKSLKFFSEFIWSLSTKWSSMLWPHEFGHLFRTKQVGGNFYFEKFVFPGIVSRLELPVNATKEHHLLALIGGFEANYLTARNTQLEFYKNGSIYNDELGLVFGNRIMYPLYSFVFSPQNPENIQTWLHEAGDPVNFTKLVWEIGNKNVFNQDGSVNKNLVSFYNETALVSLLWNLVDINFYKELKAFFSNELDGQYPTYFEYKRFSWSYGTLFNTSVLGVELYFNNYIKLREKFFSVYLKYGFPYKNNGVGFYIADLFLSKKFSFDLQSDFWRQEFYGNGFSLSINGEYKMQKLNFILQIGYKTKGYLIGKFVEKGFIGYFGVKYKFNT